MRQQLQVGEMGVSTVKTVLRSRGYVVEDLQKDMSMQKRGVDLFVEGVGYIEVKTDSYEPTNFFFELDSSGKPGAVDRSCADYFCVFFFRHHIIYLIPRAELQKWLRDHYANIKEACPNRIKHIGSSQGTSKWQATGLVVPKEELLKDIRVSVIEWTEEDEHIDTKGVE